MLRAWFRRSTVSFRGEAEKSYIKILLKNLRECFDEGQHERKISNDLNRSSVRPEALEG